MEKGYRDYGHDMDNTDTLLEVGLGFTADLTKVGGFIGKEAHMRQKASMKNPSIGLSKRLVQVLCLDPHQMLHHGEVLWRDGVVVGDVRTASYGHTLGGAVGLALVENVVRGANTENTTVNTANTTNTPNSGAGAGGGGRAVGPVDKAFLQSGRWEVEVAGARFPVRVSLAPMYDAKNARIKA
ncbi:hypothetical protein B484DRAFT_64041 [Ochromonadaceae sp. CCMP2298]|nr:hypothetical protein B484DRAFT_64041 [Ochromonadaceae sp. CCMP2298]